MQLNNYNRKYHNKIINRLIWGTIKIRKQIKRLKNIINFFLLRKVIPEKSIISLEVNVERINNFLRLKDCGSRYDFFWDGDWDKKKISLSEYPKHNINYNSMFQIYEENQDFKESDEYILKSEKIFSGQPTPRGKNLNELKDYFESLNTLKNSLNRFGYLSQIELGNKDINDEIGVVISRNGDIIKLENKFGGTHRFALCKILKIKKVIISIKAIHSSLLSKDEINELKKNIMKKNYKQILTPLIKSKLV